MSLSVLNIFIVAIFNNAHFGVAIGCTLVCVHAFFKNKEIFNIIRHTSFTRVLLFWVLLVGLVIVTIHIMFNIANSQQGIAAGVGLTSTLLNLKFENKG